MSRRRFIVAYDIRDPKRLRLVYSAMKGSGFALQYSVFICDLNRMELFRLKGRIDEIIHHQIDSVVLIDLGDPSTRGIECFEFLGTRHKLPTSGSVIV